MGDDLSATVTKVSADGTWTRLAESPRGASLGIIYSETTRFLGMKPLEHEYKVMGLAAYCKGNYHLATYHRVFEPVLSIDPDNLLRFKSTIDTSDFFTYLKDNAVGERFENVAGALQHLLETRVVEWISNAIDKTGVRNIYTSGGVFMNVKLNMRIQEMAEIERVSFLPSCGDEPLPLGALYARAAEIGIATKPLNDLYLGVSYNRDQLRTFLDTEVSADEFNITEHNDIEPVIASLLSQRHIVARFSGRCEWGARSLGNRAILAHPSHFESFYTVNDLIKARDFWMPFAPSVLDSGGRDLCRELQAAEGRRPLHDYSVQGVIRGC
jgi:carbamoyltransferase